MKLQFYYNELAINKGIYMDDMDKLIWDLVMLQKTFSDSLNLNIEEEDCPIHLGVVNKMITDKLNELFDMYEEGLLRSSSQ